MVSLSLLICVSLQFASPFWKLGSQSEPVYHVFRPVLSINLYVMCSNLFSVWICTSCVPTCSQYELVCHVFWSVCCRAYAWSHLEAALVLFLLTCPKSLSEQTAFNPRWQLENYFFFFFIITFYVHGVLPAWGVPGTLELALQTCNVWAALRVLEKQPVLLTLSHLSNPFFVFI